MGKEGYKIIKLIKIEGHILINSEYNSEEFANEFNRFLEENKWKFKGEITANPFENKDNETKIDGDLLAIWEDVMMLIRRDLTEISFNTWMKPIRPYNIDNGKLTIIVKDDFNKEVIEKRYYDLICTSMKFVTNIDFEIEVLTENIIL